MFQIIDEYKTSISVSALCRLLKCSRSGYYKYLYRVKEPTKKDLIDEFVLGLIKNIYNKHKIYGYRRINYDLKRKYSLSFNNKRIYRLMKREGIRSTIRKKRYPGISFTTVDTKAENILNRDFACDRKYQKIASDITMFSYKDKRLYLSAFMDLFNNEIIAYKVNERFSAGLVIDPLAQCGILGNLTGAIIHSDQGGHYKSFGYIRLLREAGVSRSMSRAANPLDNAAMESFFSHIKAETMLDIKQAKSYQEVKQIIDDYIYFYNNDRPQSRLKGKAPTEYSAGA